MVVPCFTLQVCVRPGDLGYRQAVPAGPRLPGQPGPGAGEYEASAGQGSQLGSLASGARRRGLTGGGPVAPYPASAPSSPSELKPITQAFQPSAPSSLKSFQHILIRRQSRRETPCDIFGDVTISALTEIRSMAQVDAVLQRFCTVLGRL